MSALLLVSSMLVSVTFAGLLEVTSVIGASSGKNLPAFSQLFQLFQLFQHLKNTIRLKQLTGSYIYILYNIFLFFDSKLDIVYYIIIIFINYL